MQASELDFATQDADVVLPTLLIYQAGELIGNLVAVDMEWGRELDYDEDRVSEVLYKHVALPRGGCLTHELISDCDYRHNAISSRI